MIKFTITIDDAGNGLCRVAIVPEGKPGANKTEDAMASDIADALNEVVGKNKGKRISGTGFS